MDNEKRTEGVHKFVEAHAGHMLFEARPFEATAPVTVMICGTCSRLVAEPAIIRRAPKRAGTMRKP